MGIVSYLKGAVSNVHRQGDKPDIFIFATPRSGSTFLMEILAAQSGMKTYDEPLTVNNEAARRELGAETWEDLTVMSNRRECYQRFFGRLAQNRIKELNRPFYRPRGRVFTNRNVFKVIHGGKDMLPWFAEAFDAMIVVLIRHPISTMLSHRQLPRLPYLLKQPDYRELFSAREIAYAERVIETGDRFEQGIVNWTLEMCAMFRPSLDPAWSVISYEDLTAYPAQSFDYLRTRLHLDPLDDLESLVTRPSGSAVQSDAETRSFIKAGPGADRSYLINKWTRRVTPDQMHRAFAICETFGLRLYEEGNLFPRDQYRVPGIPAERERIPASRSELAETS